PPPVNQLKLRRFRSRTPSSPLSSIHRRSRSTRWLTSAERSTFIRWSPAPRAGYHTPSDGCGANSRRDRSSPPTAGISAATPARSELYPRRRPTPPDPPDGGGLHG